MSTQPGNFDDDAGSTPPSDDIRAGEYVIGVLDGFERRHTQSRITSEPAFARLVDDWENLFGGWLTGVEAVPVSPFVWRRLCQRLGWTSNAAKPSRAWDSVGVWRGLAGLAAAAALAMFFIGRAPIAPPTPSVGEKPAARPVTVLQRDDGSTGWVASVDSAHGTILMVPVPRAAAGDGRVTELWIIPAGKEPVSLGALSADRLQTVDVPAALRQDIAVGATFAVSLESAQGIPHAAPTGPIVAKGGIQTI